LCKSFNCDEAKGIDMFEMRIEAKLERAQEEVQSYCSGSRIDG
jgi:hypothetical protein